MAVLALAIALPDKQARACSCAPLSPSEAFAGADRVFAGESIARNRLTGDGVEFMFAVTHVWKGAVAETIRVGSSESGGMCGFDFSTGVHYLVYARGAKGALWTGLCSRNSVVRLALWDRLWLPSPHGPIGPSRR